jgi:hypothetical protein
MIFPAPVFSLIIIGYCPHLEGWSVLQVTSALSGSCYRFCPFWNPRGSQSDYKENGLEKRQIQNEGEMPCFSPAFSEFVGLSSPCFSAKAVEAPLTLHCRDQHSCCP